MVLERIYRRDSILDRELEDLRFDARPAAHE